MKELADNELIAMIMSWENMPLVARHISDYPQYLNAVMKMVFDESDQRNWRAAWMLDKIHEIHPELIVPHLPAMTEFVLTTQNAGKKRHLLKLIGLHELPEDRMAVLLNYCIDVFTSPGEPIAVRVHAMQILFNIAQKEPDFTGELIELIENEMELHGSAGIASRGRHLIKKLIQITHPFQKQ